MQNYVHIDNIAIDSPTASLTHVLDLQGVPWRLVDKQQYQELWVAPSFKDLALDILRQWRHHQRSMPVSTFNNPLKPLLQQIKIFPVTFVVMAVCLLGTLVAYARVYNLWLFNPLGVLMQTGEWWRLITPVFLHFGWFHIVFNLLMFWYFGRAIEYAKGKFYFVGLIVLLGMASNIIQYWYTPSISFGGLSGVVYGIVGFLGLYQQFAAHPVLRIEKPLFVVLVAWLIAGMTGVFSHFGIHIANGAHLGGLLVGCLCGALAGLIDRGSKNAR